MQSCDLNPCRLLPCYSSFMWEANCSDTQGQEIYHRVRQTQLALVFLIIGCTSRTQKGKLFPIPQKTSKKKKTYKNTAVDKITSCYLFLSEAEQRENMFWFYGISSSRLISRDSIRKPLFANSLADLLDHRPLVRNSQRFFFFYCAPNTDARRVIQKSNYCKTQAGGSIS